MHLIFSKDLAQMHALIKLVMHLNGVYCIYLAVIHLTHDLLALIIFGPKFFQFPDIQMKNEFTLMSVSLLFKSIQLDGSICVWDFGSWTLKCHKLQRMSN